MNITTLRIPTGRRQTSWVFTSAAEKLNSGLQRTALASGMGFEPRTYRFQIHCSNQSATHHRLYPFNYWSAAPVVECINLTHSKIAEGTHKSYA